MTAQASETRTRARRSVLRRRDYRLLLAAFATSRLGDLLYLVALTAYVYEHTGSAAWVSAAVLGRFVPYVALSAPAGIVADRYERRLVMVASDLVQLVTMALLTVVAALSGPIVVVILLAALSAACATLYHASASATIASTVPEAELAAANALISTVDTLAYIAGPAAGGLLLLLGSPVAAFGVNAATFALSGGMLMSVRARSRGSSSGERSGALHELRDGVRALLRNRVVAALVGCLVAATLVYGVELVVLVLVSSRLLATGTAGLGWLVAASGAGGLAGAALSPRLESARHPRATIAVLVLLTGLPMASLAVIRLPALAYAVLLLEGASIVALDVLVTTAMQRTLAADVLGRVTGLILSLTAVGTAIGTLVAPALVAGTGLVTTLLLTGSVPVVLAAIGVARLTRSAPVSVESAVSDPP